MTPRPVIRWKSFWFGILVLGFLGLAWVMSMHRMAFVEWRKFFAKQASGEVTVIWGGFGRDLGVGIAPIPNPRWDKLPPAFSSAELHTDDPFSRIPLYYGRDYIFSFWFLILLFLIPWASFLVWRYRRQRKLTTNTSAFS